MKSTTRIVGLLLVFIVALCICYKATIYRRGVGFNQKTAQKIAIRLKWHHQAQFAGFYFADKAGFYGKENLAIRLIPGGVGILTTTLVASGSEQFGVAGADTILMAREKDVPIVALAVIYRRTPFILFSHKDSGITSVKQFVGKRIGVKFGSNEEITYRTMLRRSNVNAKSFKEIPVQFNMTQFFEKQIDVWPGYAINEPLFAQKQGFEVNCIHPIDYGVDIYADTLFTTEDMIRRHPKVVKAVVSATIKGWEDALKNPAKAIDYTLQYSSQLSREHETKMLAASVQFVKPDNKPVGYMDETGWESIQELLIEQGFMKKGIDIKNVFTTEFLPQENERK